MTWWFIWDCLALTLFSVHRTECMGWWMLRWRECTNTNIWGDIRVTTITVTALALGSESGPTPPDNTSPGSPIWQPMVAPPVTCYCQISDPGGSTQCCNMLTQGVLLQLCHRCFFWGLTPDWRPISADRWHVFSRAVLTQRRMGTWVALFVAGVVIRLNHFLPPLVSPSPQFSISFFCLWTWF